VEVRGVSINVAASDVGRVPVPIDHHEAAGGYVGPDRRTPVSTAVRPNVAAIAGTAACVLALWTALGVLAMHRSHAARVALIDASDSLCGAMLLASAAMLFAIWRITGRARAALGVAALTITALSFPAVSMIAGVTGVPAFQSGLAGLLRAFVKLAVLGIGVVALISPAVVARLRPWRLAVPMMLVVASGAAVAVALDVDGDVTVLAPLLHGLEVINAAGWALLGLAFMVVGRVKHRVGDILIGGGSLLLMLGSAGRAASDSSHASQALIRVGIAVLLTTLVAAAAANYLWQLHTKRGTRLMAVSSALRSARTDLADLESDQARRLHDARNAIFAIAGATELLTRPEMHPRLDPAHLQNLITVELDRLGHLLDPHFRGAASIFEVREMIEPLICAYRARGVDITCEIEDCTVYCGHDTLANAVTNILTNARVHAPGAHIWITVSPVYDAVLDADTARITIADDGPGIPAAEHDAVVLPGVRGSMATHAGSGLGLASAAQALAEVGGTLRVTAREGGGTLVTLLVPAAAGAGTEAAVARESALAARGPALVAWGPALVAQESTPPARGPASAARESAPVAPPVLRPVGL
jgi:signal transduction histidine kinase